MIDEISNRNYFDLGIGYDFTDRFRGRFGINNLLDTDPPFMAEGGHNANTDPGLYDIFGRSYYLGLAMNFGN